ncbi:MAG: AAA family ATPase [Micromonosporaceae bacterium]|nr:AAA family ATPase [Micromonosporaceae bacterium]
MRIRRVTAHAFGHLREQTLPLADGLTVVYGPNESGKSTWHAALLAALCGRWPSRGRDEPGIERRRPWAGSEWRVSAEIVLADGRRVEVWHDLDARYGYAKDLDRVADYSGEITGPGRGEVPDASRWLGLDRRAFVATACVRQSHLVLAAEDAAGVRGYVERAASTALADETVAAALDRIDSFHREQVGTERSKTRPLPVAHRRRAEAEAALRAARAGQAELEECEAEARHWRASAQAALARLRRREAALARAEAQRLRARATQARELADLVAREDALVASPVGGSSSGPALTSATEVAAAVEAWRATVAVAPPAPPAVPAVTPATGPAAGGLSAVPAVAPRVSSGATVAPSAPSGDAAVAPVSPAVPAVIPPEPSPVPASGPASGRRRSVPLFVAAGLFLVLAAVLVGLGATIAGVAAGLAALVAGAVGLFHRGRESALTAASRSAAPPSQPETRLQASVVMPPASVTTMIQPSVAMTQPSVSAPIQPAPPTVDDAVVVAQQRFREWEERLGRAERRVLAVAGQLGLSGESAADAVRDLEAWLAADRDRQAARERSAAHRARLEALLDGTSITQLEAAADRAQERAAAAELEAEQAEQEAGQAGPAAERAGQVGPPPADGPDSTVDDDVEALRRQHQEADRQATLAEQAVATLRQDRPSVAEAEEQLAAAEAECRRLEVLDDVLTRTRAFLARAQERVHRDIAPQLAAAVGRDLAAVTAGRYTETVVDTNTLAVQVRGAGGPLRDVEHLSVGTVEQVYLLVRVALAERLVRPGESCPLLLDDVTVHADQDRTRRLLDTLLTVAERHQVVLFTQQEQVRQWARTTLTGPHHALHELTTLAPA